MLSSIEDINIHYDKAFTQAKITCLKKEAIHEKFQFILDKMQECVNQSYHKEKTATIKCYFLDRPVEFSAQIDGNKIIVTRHCAANE